MNRDQIQPGMIFNPDDQTTWQIIEEGNYILENKVRVSIDNKFKNKWWCQKLDCNDPPILFCFDRADDTWRFRFQTP